MLHVSWDRASDTVVDVWSPLDVGPRKKHAPRPPTLSPSSARQRGQSERSQDADGVRDLYLSPRRPGPGHWRMVSGSSEYHGKGRSELEDMLALAWRYLDGVEGRFGD